MNPSHNLFIIGPTGAGKTSIGRRLAVHYGLPFVDIDQEIERHCGVDVSTVFELEGEAGFRQPRRRGDTRCRRLRTQCAAAAFASGDALCYGNIMGSFRVR